MTTTPSAEARKDRVLVDAETAILARRFPDVAVWFGAATRRWWALVGSAGRWRLVEAGGPHDLSQLIVSARAASSPSRSGQTAIALIQPPTFGQGGPRT